MSTKTFCDVCKAEITSANQLQMYQRVDAPPIEGFKFSFSAKVIDGKPPTERTDICKYCALDALKKLDDRPVADEPQKPHLRAQETPSVLAGFPATPFGGVVSWQGHETESAFEKWKATLTYRDHVSIAEREAFMAGWRARQGDK